jgi:DMSO/TMAO reductase YedYZ molybdopterin-dependent catalytic subunit
MTRPHIPRVRPAVTADEIWPELILISRRFMLTRGLSLGGLALLTGCDLSTHSGVDAALWKMMRFNDRVLAALFSRTRLAPTYPVRAVTNPFRFNAYYQDWQLVLSGLVTDKTPWTVDKMRALPLEAQVTRHICIEGWSQIGQWSGVPLHVFLQRAGADLKARYVSFECFDGYSTSIDMPSALHPQTILALDFLGKPLTPEWGAPVRLRIPTKLGFKSAKNFKAISVTNTYPGAATGKTRVTTGFRDRSACLFNSVARAQDIRCQV